MWIANLSVLSYFDSKEDGDGCRTGAVANVGAGP